MGRAEYYDGATLVKEPCPRCEDAYLAEHEDRSHCGRCGYTEWK